MPSTHALLVKLAETASTEVEHAAAMLRWRDQRSPVFAGVHAYRGVASARSYIYFELAVPAAWSPGDRRAFATTLVTGTGPRAGAVTVDRLECVHDVAGASAGARRSLHYVVETDVEDGWQDELQRWYDTEHLPGLAAVPGCIRARRFVNHDAGPHSLACYDLAHAGVTESAPWLAVRATPWSDRVRPRFRNTLRTMFAELESGPGAGA